MHQNTVEISRKGKWIKVPGFDCQNNTIVVTGKWIRTARVHDEAWKESELRDPIACLREINERKLGADIFTFTQMPPGRSVEYAYPWESDSIAVISVTSFNEWWIGLPQETRKNVRRSARCGVRIEIKPLDDDLVRALVALNNSSSVRQGRRYTHYGKSFDQVKRDHSSFLDSSDFVCAYLGDELVGFLKLVYRGKVASVLNLLTKDEHHDKRPANALIKTAVERCESKGILYLTYGYFNYGKKHDTTITQFKVRHGFEERLIPRYFVPLTLLGKIYMALGLHRGMIGLLPNRVLLAAIALRAKWYSVSRWSRSGRSSLEVRSNRDRQTERSTPAANSSS